MLYKKMYLGIIIDDSVIDFYNRPRVKRKNDVTY